MAKNKQKMRGRELQADIEAATISSPRRKSCKRSPTRVGRPKGKARNAEQREAIAAAALKLFSKIGFAQVSNNEIGDLAGVNPALIYYYFEDRDDLFQFVVRKALDDALSVYQNLRRDGSGVGGLEAWLSSNLLLSEEISRFLKVVLDYAHSGRQSRLTDDAIARFYRAEIEILASALCSEIGIASSKAMKLAQLVSVLLDGVMVARVVRPDIDLKHIVNSMRELLGPKRS
jgi:AcrR family transcriptional regulator